MARFVLTVLALVFITCAVADCGGYFPDSSESENESELRLVSKGNESDQDAENSTKEKSNHSRANETESGKTKVTLPSGRTAYIKNHADKMKETSDITSKTILLALDPSDDEYKLMENEMQSTILVQSNSSLHFSKYNISKIERIINGYLMKTYKTHRGLIEYEGYLNERMLFFESSKADEVVAYGFDKIYNNINGAFGAGLYFTEYSSISNQYAVPFKDSHCMTCERKIIVSRVTLGNIYKTKHAMTHTNSPAGYHSLQGVASPGGLKNDEYVIKSDNQAYPDYVITYNLIP